MAEPPQGVSRVPATDAVRDGAGVPAVPGPTAPSPPTAAVAPSRTVGLPPSPFPLHAPARRRRWSGLWTSLVIVVTLSVATGIVGALFLASTPARVEVLALYVYSPDDVCGLASTPSGYFGFNSTADAQQALQLLIPNYNSTACTVRDASTNTSGFGLATLGLPLRVPGNGTEELDLTLSMPGSAFLGIVHLVFR